MQQRQFQSFLYLNRTKNRYGTIGCERQIPIKSNNFNQKINVSDVTIRGQGNIISLNKFDL